MKYLDIPKEQHTDFLNHMNERWNQLYHLDKDWSERAIKYLFLVNSGGAIATLSFMGALGQKTPWSIPVALLLFIVGVTFVGIMHAVILHKMASLFANWRRDSEKFLKNEINRDKLLSDDSNRTKSSFGEYCLGYIAFGLFVAGAFFGGVSFFVFRAANM